MWCLIWAFNYLFYQPKRTQWTNYDSSFEKLVAVFLAADWVDIIQRNLCLYTLQNHNLGLQLAKLSSQWGGGPLHPDPAAGWVHAVGELTEAVEQNMDYQLQYRMNDSLKNMDDLANLIQHK